MGKRIPTLLELGGPSVTVIFDCTETCASHRRGWFGRKRCDCGALTYTLTNPERIRQAYRYVFSGGTDGYA